MATHGGGEQEQAFTLTADCVPSGHTAITWNEKQPAYEVGITVLVAEIIKLLDVGGRPVWQQAGSLALMITLYVVPGTGSHEIRLPAVTGEHFRLIGVVGLQEGGEQEHIFALAWDLLPSGHIETTYHEKQLANDNGITVLVAAVLNT